MKSSMLIQGMLTEAMGMPLLILCNTLIPTRHPGMLKSSAQYGI